MIDAIQVRSQSLNKNPPNGSQNSSKDFNKGASGSESKDK